MESSLKEIFAERTNRQKLIDLINSDNTKFKEAINLALGNEQPMAWRSAWIINHAIKTNDERVVGYVPQLINAVAEKEDGHQRELLKIISKMKVSENEEGRLFDICITIWETLRKSGSVRITAFKALVGIAKKYPELIEEIEFLTRDEYITDLGSGIKATFMKIKKHLV